MSATVWPVTDTFVAEIGDADLSKPLSDADFRIVEDAFERYAVLVFPDQVLSQDQHIDFARRFGPIDRSMIVEVEGAKLRVPGEIADVSSLDSQGRILAPDNRLRHAPRVTGKARKTFSSHPRQPIRYFFEEAVWD